MGFAPHPFLVLRVCAARVTRACPVSVDAVKYTAVLFDLDGTIADSAPGITRCMAETFAHMGVPVPSPAEMLAFVGPPISESFRELARIPADRLQEAIDYYRELYRTEGALEAEPYPGALELVRNLGADDVPLSLATSKPESQARRIIERFGILDCFLETTGASEDEKRSSKAAVVGEALTRLKRDGVDVSRPVLIGDRHHDVEGAAEHGVPTILAGWGYGSPAEAAGAIAVAEHPADVIALLG